MVPISPLEGFFYLLYFFFYCCLSKLDLKDLEPLNVWPCFVELESQWGALSSMTIYPAATSLPFCFYFLVEFFIRFLLLDFQITPLDNYCLIVIYVIYF